MKTSRLITVNELKEQIDNAEPVLIIDIREADEFQESRIEGSVNYPKPDFDKYITQIPYDIPVVLCCKYGKKSEQINLMLRADHNYKNISSLVGGLYEWSREIDPSMDIW
jgi:sulfur-carrier protein adenylyltransferase/sulfurtransferase